MVFKLARVDCLDGPASLRVNHPTALGQQRMKHRLLNKAKKTVNNILTVLNVMLKKAVEWDVIDRLPCTIKILPVSQGSTQFYDFDEFERLPTAAEKTHPRAH